MYKNRPQSVSRQGEVSSVTRIALVQMDQGLYSWARELKANHHSNAKHVRSHRRFRISRGTVVLRGRRPATGQGHKSHRVASLASRKTDAAIGQTGGHIAFKPGNGVQSQSFANLRGFWTRTGIWHHSHLKDMLKWSHFH